MGINISMFNNINRYTSSVHVEELIILLKITDNHDENGHGGAESE